MIQPMQYFQIENVPMFRGAYMILSVEHSITANHMKTSFEGVRIAKVPVPFVSTPFTSADHRPETAQDITQSVPVNTPSPNIVTDSNFTIPEGGLDYPAPSVKKSMENLFGANQGVLKLDNTTNNN
ncbi:MAG: hypothetical protein HC836_36365 [Richelia sp. RM2_1_2]|nr:hypothetical protein [Richelia sp. RM2_1_2]